MNIEKKLYGYDNLFNFFVRLDQNKKMPNKFIISGKKGIGKSTFAYHLINYLFSKNEDYKYDLNNFELNDQNRSFKLVKENAHQNFFLIDLDDGKEKISIDKVRKSFEFINKSSMNNEYRIILINNVELLNINSSNALLKIIEEPNEKLIFILIHNSSYKLLKTLESRCFIFKKSFSEDENLDIFEKIIGNKYNNLFNDNLLCKFMTIGELIYLKNFLLNNKIQEKTNTKCIIDFYLNLNKYDKKNNTIILKLIQVFLHQKNMKLFNEKDYLWCKSFFKKVSDANKYNLDMGNLFFEFKTNFK